MAKELSRCLRPLSRWLKFTEPAEVSKSPLLWFWLRSFTIFFFQFTISVTEQILFRWLSGAFSGGWAEPKPPLTKYYPVTEALEATNFFHSSPSLLPVSFGKMDFYQKKLPPVSKNSRRKQEQVRTDVDNCGHWRTIPDRVLQKAKSRSTFVLLIR